MTRTRGGRRFAARRSHLEASRLPPTARAILMVRKPEKNRRFTMRSMKIKTVVAESFREGNETITPILTLRIDWTQGGVDLRWERVYSRGYEISVRHELVSSRGCRIVIDDGKGHPFSNVKESEFFSLIEIMQIAEEVYRGLHDELISRLYAEAKENRSQYKWQETMLPVNPVISSDIELLATMA